MKVVPAAGGNGKQQNNFETGWFFLFRCFYVDINCVSVFLYGDFFCSSYWIYFSTSIPKRFQNKFGRTHGSYIFHPSCWTYFSIYVRFRNKFGRTKTEMTQFFRLKSYY